MKLKITVILFLTLLLIVTCSLDFGGTVDKFMSEEVAEHLANEETGLLTAVTDVEALIEGSGAAEGAEQGIFDLINQETRATIVVTTSSDELDSSFDPFSDASGDYYEQSGNSVSISTAMYTATVNYTLTVRFYESTDGTGNSTTITGDTTIPIGIKSMRYIRTITGTMTELARNRVRVVDMETTFLITGLNDGSDSKFNIDIEACTIDVAGTGAVTGSWTVVLTGTGLSCERTTDSTGTYVAYNGTLNGTYSGTYVIGIIPVIVNDKQVTITLDGSRKTTFSVGSSGSVTVDITTGSY